MIRLCRAVVTGIAFVDSLPLSGGSDLVRERVAAAEPESLVEPADHQRCKVDFEILVRTGKNEHLGHGRNHTRALVGL